MMSPYSTKKAHQKMGFFTRTTPPDQATDPSYK
jgi:hypothetical protein